MSPVRLLLAALLVALVPSAGAQPAEPAPDSLAAPDWSQPLVSIRSIRQPAERGAPPTRLGETVLVAGRVTAGTGAVRADASEVYLQDGTGGLRLRLPPMAEPVITGDSVLVHGTVAFRNGMVEMVAPAVRRLGGPSRTPAPRRLAPGHPGDGGTPALERHEGERVEVEGRVVQIDSTEAGRLLVLLSGTDLVQVFAYRLRASPVRFEGVRLGDYVRVRGIAAQHDLAAPYTGSYLVLPLSEADVRSVGLSPTEYKYGAIGVAGLLLGALLWAWALRVQVRRRTSALRLSEARYETLFDAASDPVLVLDAHHAGRVVEANEAAQHAFGVGSDGHLGGVPARLSDLVHDPEEAASHLREAARTGATTSVLEVRAAGDGRAIPFEVATRRLRANGSTLLVSVARDIEERRAYEHGLLEAIETAEAARAEAEEAAHLKAAILANMSHEIRTPLTAILGFADVLNAEVDPEQREFVEAIEVGGQRLLDTLNDVLEYARLDAEGAAFRAAPTDAVEVVRSAVSLLVPLARRKRIELSLQSTVPTFETRLAAGAFGRVVTNLVGNAIKFTERGSVRATLYAAPGRLTLRVRDTGVGISDEFLPRMFEAFTQESEGHDRAFEGTGLGLAITHRLVEGMGGTIRVESERGVGTLFEVSLPAPPSHHASEAPAPPPAAPRRAAAPATAVA